VFQPSCCSRLALPRRSLEFKHGDPAPAGPWLQQMENRQFPRRPPRLDLFQNVQPFYFVTFNTHKRLSLLARPEIHQVFRSFCVAAEERNVAVGRYVLMPDHIHLFVALPNEGMTLGRWIQSLKSLIGKTLLGLGVCKPHWQEGFLIMCCEVMKVTLKNGTTSK
jgi:hypothetical protein